MKYANQEHTHHRSDIEEHIQLLKDDSIAIEKRLFRSMRELEMSWEPNQLIKQGLQAVWKDINIPLLRAQADLAEGCALMLEKMLPEEEQVKPNPPAKAADRSLSHALNRFSPSIIRILVQLAFHPTFSLIKKRDHESQ